MNLLFEEIAAGIREHPEKAEKFLAFAAESENISEEECEKLFAIALEAGAIEE